MAWKIFWSGAPVFAVLLAVYVYSLYQGYFFMYWWWDIPMHLSGGVLAGLIGAWCAALLGHRPAYFAAITGAIVLGVGVEIAEELLGFTYSPFMSHEADIIKDLFNDAIGGALVGYILSRL